MKRVPFMAIATLTMAITATSCIDDKYDLTDIDTTIQVNVNDLIVPVNIDEIKLKSIIDETDEIQIIDGEYAYVTDGTFNSDPININEIMVKIGKINDSNIRLKSIGGVPLPNVDISYKIDDSDQSIYSAFSFVASDVNENIKDLTRAYGSITVDISLDLSGFKSLTPKIELHDLLIQLPKNLEIMPSDAGKYDPATGLYALNNLVCSTSTPCQLTITATSFTLEKGQFEANKGELPGRGLLHIDSELGLAGGTVFISKDWHTATLPENMSAVVKYDIADFTVDYIDGMIEYDIENVNIPTVSLDDIPDFLNQPGTDLRFSNPMLYLSTNNPMEEDHLYAQTGIEITAYRDDEEEKTFAPDDDVFTIAKDHVAPDGIYNFVIAPVVPVNPDAGFPDAKFVKFSTLGDVLSGNGLPKSVQVSLIDPQIPLQRAERFHLGVTYDGIKGKYKFIAPFDLKDGSVIQYSDKLDGWADDDLDAVTITSLEVSLTVSTDIPMEAKFTGYPIDKSGNRISGVSIEDAQIAANAKDQAVCIKVTGTIHELDGMEFEVIAVSSGGNLAPEGKIILKNVRPKVSGYYTKEL